MQTWDLLAAIVATLLAELAPGAAFAQGQTIRPSKNLITGLVDGEEVEKLKPPSGFLTKQEDFAKLWKAWLLEEQVPKVDFTGGMNTCTRPCRASTQSAVRITPEADLPRGGGCSETCGPVTGVARGSERTDSWRLSWRANGSRSRISSRSSFAAHGREASGSR